ncbi:MAG: hypothetical protein GYA24_04830 [Candidatus Lokiarchaeota archaeon]|nr:hypothetical protein [Candidatus Lokiarchaeota archaeon]
MAHIDLVKDLSEYVLGNLSGAHNSCKRVVLKLKPEKHFIIGSLADKDKDWSPEEPREEVRTKSAIRHNSMSVIFKEPNRDQGKITISPACSVFVKVYPSFQEQKEHVREQLDKPELAADAEEDPQFPMVYVRHDCPFNPISVDTKTKGEHLIPLEFTDHVTKIFSSYDVFRGGSIDKADIEDEDTYNKKVEKLSSRAAPPLFWEACLSVERERFNEGEDLVTVRLINTTPGKDENKKPMRYATFLFNASLTIDLTNTTLVPFKYNYEHEDIMLSKDGMLRCLNCHANIVSNIIHTSNWASFAQEKVIPRITFGAARCAFSELAGKSAGDWLKVISDEMDRVAIVYRKNPAYADKGGVYFKKTEHFNALKDRFDAGIQYLALHPIAMQAFNLMQQTFLVANAATGITGWRLFQLVFLVAVIPHVDPATQGREVTDVLHVKTGGGKSEAYFGLAVYTVFWDRLRGKKEGVSGIVKFPLRMLSIQQLQRFTNTIIYAERIRKEKKIPGKPFSLGYFVGVSDAFPRFDSDEVKKIKQLTADGKDYAGLLVTKCPFCHNTVIRIEDSETNSIIHQCKGCSEKFFLYYTNEDTYRFIPSFIVSTVDKLAGVSL